MAYTKLTDFAAKDALLTGNPSKVVKGTEIGAEFDSLAVEDALNVKTSVVSVASGKVLTVSNTMTLTATDGSTLAIGTGGTLGTAAYTAAASYEVLASKDATGGYAGLTLFKLNLKNAANTFTNYFTNTTTASRTWTLPDKDGTVAMMSDVAVTGGDFFSSETSSVDNEIVLYSGTGGKTAKRATTTGILTATSGVIGAAVSGTDIKTVNGQSLIGSGDVTVAGDVAGPASSVDSEIALFDSTTGKLIKRASTTGILKGTSGVLSAASAGTDYVAPGTATTFTAQQTFKEVKDTVHTITDGAAFEIDPANGSIQVVTLGANRTPAATNFEAGQCVLLGIDDGTAYTVTWSTVAPTWVKSGGTGAAPDLATSGYTWVLLWKVSSTMYGAIVGSP